MPLPGLPVGLTHLQWAVSCSNLNHLHATLWRKHVIPNHQLTATGDSSSALEIGCYIHYCDIERFLNFKLDEKCVQVSLIFPLLTSLCDSLRILPLIWMFYLRLLYLFWYFYSQVALHLEIIGRYILNFCYILSRFNDIFPFSNMPLLSQVSLNLYLSHGLLE